MLLCREALLQRLLQVSMLICLLQVQLCSSQSTDIQVSRLDGSIINILQHTEYYVFEGEGIVFKCLCSNQGANMNTRIVSLRWIHKGQIQESIDQCITLTHTISEATSNDGEEHECEVSYANGTVTRHSAGILEVIDPGIVVAPPSQYGIVGTSSTLNCTTTSSETSSVSITWFYDGENGVQVPNQFDRVEINHEGIYVCSVFLGTLNLRAVRMINFSVIVPPAILIKPNEYIHLLGNRPVRFPINFQSRFQSETVIVWYKNQNSAVHKEYIRTEYTDEPNAMTELYFANLRRSDAGLYTAVIQNTFSELSPDLRKVQTSFQLDVTVFPVAPSNIRFIDISSTQAKVEWELSNQNEDDRPDNITVRLYYTNKTIVSQHTVNGTSTELILDLIPGTEYKLLMTSANIDGEMNSTKRDFMSIDGPPSSPHLAVERTGSTVFNITVSLAYTGGGDITQFMVEFMSKENPTAGWRLLGALVAEPTGNVLEWRVIAMHEYLSEQALEFRVAAVNMGGYVSEPSLQLEPYDLPGPPTQPNHISSTHDSLLIQVQLSSLGSAPIIAVHLQFEDFNRTLEIREYSLGELVQARIEGLQSDTMYQFVVIAENYGGLGEPSPMLEAATENLPPVPLYGMVLISVGTALAIILAVAILIIVVRHIYTVRKDKRQYRVDSGSRSEAGKTPDGSDKLVSGTKRPPLPKIPTQTRTQTSVSSDNPRPGSQSAYSRQGSTSTYPLSPQRTISTSDGGSPIEEFKFDHRRDSVTMSNESESEVNYPRYSYRVSPSPPNLSTPQLILPISSLHSMQSYPSTITNLTESSDSTRDSIILSPTEFKATNV